MNNRAILFLDERLEGRPRSYLAERLGVGHPLVHQWWAPGRRVHVRHLNALAEALDMTEDERRRLHWLSARDHGFDV